MGYWDYYKGPIRDYHRDPFPHSLLRTREFWVQGAGRTLSHAALGCRGPLFFRAQGTP